mmetsp:Transcript_14846/g.35084  ORF Transcript_14846/g.35084 Transcript_14846/m.35084 type:complete len:212 (-) Transcript_14846:4872-5507(-)
MGTRQGERGENTGMPELPCRGQIQRLNKSDGRGRRLRCEADHQAAEVQAGPSKGLEVDPALRDRGRPSEAEQSLATGRNLTSCVRNCRGFVAECGRDYGHTEERCSSSFPSREFQRDWPAGPRQCPLGIPGKGAGCQEVLRGHGRNARRAASPQVEGSEASQEEEAQEARGRATGGAFHAGPPLLGRLCAMGHLSIPRRSRSVWACKREDG